MKCGLEIHQQLNGGKLFCSCAASNSPPVEHIFRSLYASVGELGVKDRAAAFEEAKNKEFNYLVSDDVCLVECDEEPPHEINKHALVTAIKGALLLNASLFDELHVMRKIVVDGSNTSGFQRTLLLAEGGYIKVENRRIDIQTVCLEEDSASIGNKGKGTYNLNRLGVPLIEIATAPQITSPSEARAVAENIGQILRSLDVRRGIGTIRQDINISVEGGSRVEIKGVQSLNFISDIVRNEVQRQKTLLRLKKKIRTVAKPVLNIKNVSKIFANTQCSLVKRAFEEGKNVFVLPLPGFKNLLGVELMPAFRFGSELSDYAKIFSGVKGIIHGDENLLKYGFSENELDSLNAYLKLGKKDNFVMCIGNRQKAFKALEAVHKRIIEAYHKIPEETRMADKTISHFMRPMPGKDRMYPETDIRPILSKKYVEIAKNNLPPLPSEILKHYKKIGLNEELAEALLKSKYRSSFEKFSKVAEPKFVAVILLQTIKKLKREGTPVEKLDEKKLLDFFESFSKLKFVKAASEKILRQLSSTNKTVKQIIEEESLRPLGSKDIKRLSKREKLNYNQFMAKYRLKADPKDVKKLIKN